jgi:hypothetical protein
VWNVTWDSQLGLFYRRWGWHDLIWVSLVVFPEQKMGFALIWRVFDVVE